MITLAGVTVCRTTGAMGHVLWTTPHGAYLWCGAGSRLLLVWGDSLIPVDHPTASGVYDRERDARDALGRFLSLLSPEAR